MDILCTFQKEEDKGKKKVLAMQSAHLRLTKTLTGLFLMLSKKLMTKNLIDWFLNTEEYMQPTYV